MLTYIAKSREKAIETVCVCVLETEKLTLSGLLDIYGTLKKALQKVPMWDSNSLTTCVQTISYNTEISTETNIAPSKLSEHSFTCTAYIDLQLLIYIALYCCRRVLT